MATPVLCLHSGGFSSRQWRRLAELLAPAHRVVVPDLIGYGASPRLPAGQPFRYREDLPPLLAHLTEPMHVVGHSYGGLLALQLALARPKMIASLALYEPVAFGILSPDERDGALEVLPYDGEPWLERFIDWWQGPGAWARMAPEARAAFASVGWKVYSEVATLTVDATDRATYATIAAPTLLLGGGHTPAIEQRILAKLATALPRARLQVFPEMGHMGPITHGAIVNAAIAAHIASV